MLSKFFVFFKKMFLFLVLTLAFLFRSNFVISYRKDVHTGENSPNNFKTGIIKFQSTYYFRIWIVRNLADLKSGLTSSCLVKYFIMGNRTGSVRDNIDKRMKVIHA